MSTDRFDDWYNSTGSIGTSRDKHRGIQFVERARLGRKQLEALYTQNALAARIVDQIAEDSLREGWELDDVVMADGSTLDLDAVYSAMDTLKVNVALEKATKWSRLFGGAVVAIPVYDRRDPSVAMAPDGAVDIFPLKVVDAYDARPNFTDGDFASPTYLETLDYDISGIATQTVRVHHSRVIPFEPISLPPRTLYESSGQNVLNWTGWGPSILERLYDELARDGAAASHAVGMMYISSILHFAIEGYASKFGTKGGPETMQKWLASFRKNMDSMGVAATDSKDTLSNLSLSVTGAHELLGKLRDRVAAIANMPREILFNESPAGLNAGMLSGPQELWFQKCQVYQAQVLTPALDKILEAFFRVRGLPVLSWKIKWRPLWTRSVEADAEVHSKNAAADVLYIQEGVLDPETVMRERFVNGNMGAIKVDADPESTEPAVGPLDLMGEEPAAAARPGTDLTPAIAIIEKVTAGLIPRDSGAALLRTGGFDPALLGSAGEAVAETDPAASTDAVPEDVLSPQDAAARFSIPTRAITKAIDERRLRYWGIGAHKRVSLAEVASLARSHEEATSVVAPEEP